MNIVSAHIVDDIKAVVDKFIRAAEKIVNIQEAYIFGSCVVGKNRFDSDIDLAIVSEDFTGNKFIDAQKFNDIVIDTDPRIEIHTYKPQEFREDVSLFVKEIKEKGIKVK